MTELLLLIAFLAACITVIFVASILAKDGPPPTPPKPRWGIFYLGKRVTALGDFDAIKSALECAAACGKQSGRATGEYTVARVP